MSKDNKIKLTQPQIQHFENVFPVFMQRLNTCFLDGETLREFSLNKRIPINKKIYLGIIGNYDKISNAIKERAYSFKSNYQKIDNTHWIVKINKPLFQSMRFMKVILVLPKFR